MYKLSNQLQNRLAKQIGNTLLNIPKDAAQSPDMTRVIMQAANAAHETLDNCRVMEDLLEQVERHS